MAQAPKLEKITLAKDFQAPLKRIHDGTDVQFFLSSLAYKDIMTFILQLNRSVVPRKVQGSSEIREFRLDDINTSGFSPRISSLRRLLEDLDKLILDAPPDPGPRRFGNVSFRRWFELVQSQADELILNIIPENMKPALVELKSYLLGSFGSPPRLDYGTGHELSFLAFLGALWKLGYFHSEDDEAEERSIVLGVFEPYFTLIRKLIKTYNLEPAGSHGVWGLDDNSFLPYLFGSAQLSPAIDESDETPIIGSLTSAPDPSIVTKTNEVERGKASNMYFSAIAFIYDVKKGPFWEHSPVLFDISGIKDGWGKINKGMVKMYNAEVLSKFPVVQHFPFGSIFEWEKDPEAKFVPNTTHTANQPLRNPTSIPSQSQTMRPPGIGFGPTSGTAAPWAGNSTRLPPAPIGFANGVTQAPWKSRTPVPPSTRGARNLPTRTPMQGNQESAVQEQDDMKRHPS